MVSAGSVGSSGQTVDNPPLPWSPIMNRTLFTLTGIAVALAVAGCCKSKSGDTGSSAESSPTANASGARGGSAADGETLTGEDGVKKLKAKGWKPMLEPTTTEAGPAKTTVFISTMPDSITVTFAEYKDLSMAMMAHTGMKSTDTVVSERFGRTVVYIACPPPKDKAKCQKAIDDLK